MEPHQPAMGLFRQRVQRQCAFERRGRAGSIAGRRFPRGKLDQQRNGQLMEACSLLRQPFVERRVVNPEAFEQRAAAQLGGGAQALQVVALGQGGQVDHVGVDRAGVDGQGLALGDEGIILDCAADGGEGLAQAVARLLVAAIAPQQADQPFARLGLAGAAQQQRQHRFRLAGGQGKRRPIRPDGGKPAQHVHPKPRHMPLALIRQFVNAAAG